MTSAPSPLAADRNPGLRLFVKDTQVVSVSS